MSILELGEVELIWVGLGRGKRGGNAMGMDEKG